MLWEIWVRADWGRGVVVGDQGVMSYVEAHGYRLPRSHTGAHPVVEGRGPGRSARIGDGLCRSQADQLSNSGVTIDSRPTVSSGSPNVDLAGKLGG